MQGDLAGDTRLPPLAAGTSAVAARSLRRHAETSIEGMSIAAAAPITADVGITVVADIMAPVLASVSAFTRLTDMPLQSAIPRGSMMPMACGNTIRVALCPTDIDQMGASPNRDPGRTGSGHRWLPLPEYCR
jgi:hypothetical protein